MKISAIIFDLGGVFLDLDYNKTSVAFKSLGVANFDDFYQQSFTNPLFAALEKGQVDKNAFFDALSFTSVMVMFACWYDIKKASGGIAGCFKSII